MSDIRRLELDKRENPVILAVPKEQFMLGPERMRALEAALPEICKLSYWGPEYQAWEPFVLAYLRGGLAVSMATKFLPILSDKAKVIYPLRDKLYPIICEVQHLYRCTSSECFENITWEEIEEFLKVSSNMLERDRVYTKRLYNKANYVSLLSALLELPEGEQYSPNLAYAVYLYRHCMIDDIRYTPEFLARFQAQLNAYVEKFRETFAVVQNFIGEGCKVYRWYSQPVCDLICHAWLTALDLSSKRQLISNTDVFSMEVWLSEQLTDYISSLPCYYTEHPSIEFIWAALNSVEDLKENDPHQIYQFCIPKKYLRSFFEKLSRFYWDVKEGRFIPLLEALAKAEYLSGDTASAKSPEQYRIDLQRRGFPVDSSEEV